MYLMSAAGHHADAVHELLERDDHLRALREALRLARDENALVELHLQRIMLCPPQPQVSASSASACSITAGSCVAQTTAIPRSRVTRERSSPIASAFA